MEVDAYRVDFEEAKTISDPWLIMSDVQFVGLASKRLLKYRDGIQNDPVLPRCLWTGAIEAYSRCFATGRRSRLNKEEVFDGQPDALKMHDYLLTLRNEHTAHSVNGLEQSEAGIMISEDGEWTVANLADFANAPPTDIVKALDQTSEFVWNWVKLRSIPVHDELLVKAKALGEPTIKSYPKIKLRMKHWLQ